MKEVKEKISNYYFNYLTLEEQNSLERMSELELRNLVNNIWDRVIFNKYTQGEEFKILARLGSSIEFVYYDIDKCLPELFKLKDGTYQIISSSSINDSLVGYGGLVGKIDWTTTKDILLPMDLLEKTYISGIFLTQGVYSLNCGEKEISSEYDTAKMYADILGLPFLDINVKLFNPDIEVKKDKIVVDVVCKYILDKYQKMDFNLREKLIRIAKKKIISLYEEYSGDVDLFFQECYKFMDEIIAKQRINS